MLEPGFYEMATLEPDGHTTWGQCQVEETRGTLIKVRRGGGEVVWLNTAASTFISAKPVAPRPLPRL